MNATIKRDDSQAASAPPRLVKAADRAADREARLRNERALRAKRELSLNAILNQAVGCAPRNPRALFDALFQVAEP